MKFAKPSRDLAVPWEQELPPEKRRYDVRYIRGGPGKSGMGIVYLAYDREFREPYAIKTFQDRFLRSPRAVENFKKEAQVWVELGKHKNIVEAIRVEIFVGRPYIFLEMVAGDELYGADLSGWIRDKGLELPLMVNFAIQFCRGMRHAEKRFREMGRIFVHRDIKPENIMITHDKVLKVTDFGLVYALKNEVLKSEMIGNTVDRRFSVMSQQGIYGTPFYMSPEQILQGAEVLKQAGILKNNIKIPPLDVRSDMYAFGCVLYAMVLGKPPFWQLPFDFSRYCYQTLYEEPEPVASSGNKRFDNVILNLLQKYPERRRYSNFTELEETLQGIHESLTGQRFKKELPDEMRALELANKGASYGRLGMYEQGIESCNKAIEVNPKYALSYANRGICFYNLGQYEKAIEDFNMAIELDPEYVPTYTSLGNIYSTLGQYEKAINLHTMAIDRDSEYSTTYHNRGNVYSALGQYERAIEDYNTAIELEPQKYETYRSRGLAYEHLNLYKQAIQDFTTAIALNPLAEEAYANRAHIHAVLGQYELTIPDYNRVIEINPMKATAYFGIGVAHHYLRRAEQAIKYYTKAIMLNPEYVEAYLNRGSVYDDVCQYEKAIEDYTKAIMLNPKFVEPYVNRGISYANLKQYRQAIADYSRFIELAPSQYAQQINAVQQEICRLEGLIGRR